MCFSNKQKWVCHWMTERNVGHECPYLPYNFSFTFFYVSELLCKTTPLFRPQKALLAVQAGLKKQGVQCSSDACISALWVICVDAFLSTLSNEVEAECTAVLCEQLVNCGLRITPQSIGIICPYAGQKHLVSNKLFERSVGCLDGVKTNMFSHMPEFRLLAPFLQTLP